MTCTALEPSSFTNLDKLQRALLTQMRRFRSTAAVSRPLLNAKLVAKGGAKESEVLDTLISQLRILKNMQAQVLTMFPGDAKAEVVRKSIETFTREVEANAVALRRKMSEEARGKAGSKFVQLAHNLIELLQDDMQGMCTGIKDATYLTASVTPPDGGEAIAVEVVYTLISNLHISGYTYPKYYVVIAHPTATASKQPPLLITTSTNFRTPSGMKWEATARSGNELHKIVKNLLTQDGVIGKTMARKSSARGRRVPNGVMTRMQNMLVSSDEHI